MNKELAQKESEFSYVANFIDSSLILITQSKRGYLLNYVNDVFLKSFQEYFSNINSDCENEEETNSSNYNTRLSNFC